MTCDDDEEVDDLGRVSFDIEYKRIHDLHWRRKNKNDLRS